MSTNSSQGLYAWHVVREDGTTKYLEVAELVGVRYKVKRKQSVKPCLYGFHASVNPLDALCYGDGIRFKRVWLEGCVSKENQERVDKYAGNARTTLFEVQEVDAERILSEFALWCIESVAKPASIKALRKAGLETEANSLESCAFVTDKKSAFAFENAALKVLLDLDAATEVWRVLDATVGTARARRARATGEVDADSLWSRWMALWAAQRATKAEMYADKREEYAAYNKIGEELTKRLLNLAPANYTEEDK